LLVGWNADEGSYFAAHIKLDSPSYVERIRTQFKDQAERVLQFYPPGSTVEEQRASFAALVGDQIIAFGGWAWSKRTAMSGKSPVFRYYFTRRPPGAPELSINPIAAPGVYHFAEIYYVFNNLNVMKDWPWSPEDRRLADAVSSYWTNFAKTGDPNGLGLPHWETFKPGREGQVIQLGETIKMQPHLDRYEFLDALYAKMGSR
jgi:para-nitrobenzyl esterase